MKKTPGARVRNKAALRNAAQETDSVPQTLSALLVVISTHGDGDAKQRLTSLCQYDGSVRRVAKIMMPDISLRRAATQQVRGLVPVMAALEPGLKGFKIPPEASQAQSSKASRLVEEMLAAIPAEDDLHDRWLASAKVKKLSLTLRT